MARKVLTAACLLTSPLLVANTDPLVGDPLIAPAVEDAPLVFEDIAPLPSPNCADTWETVMEERGQAQFRREPASPDRPQMVRAVDYNIGGCDFMVTSSGIQPLPPRSQAEAPLLHRAQ